MSTQNYAGAVLQFLNAWEEGKIPLLQDYLKNESAETCDMAELMADCIIFEALADCVHKTPTACYALSN